MIQTVANFALPAGESLRIMKNRIMPLHGHGPRISIVTGIHGDELEGQFVCYELQRRIQAERQKLKGIVDVYPALNPMGIDTITRGIPGFDLDMNRTFPGSSTGAVTEQIAGKVMEDLAGSDLVIDIHASNLFLREIPQVRISEETAETLVPYAKLLNVDLIWVHSAATVLRATLAHSLNARGVKTLVVEMGVGMRVTPEYGKQLTDGIFNVMKFLGVWDGYPENLSRSVCLGGSDVSYMNAPVSGVFLPSVLHQHLVQEGESIGQILDPLRGEVLADLKAPCGGLVFTLREYPIVDEGSLIARILKR